MFDWLRKRDLRAPEAEQDEDAVRQHGYHMSGTYRLLYKYLEHRYASITVLTFAQIEDLLGFRLPDRARTDREWWTVADTGTAEPRYSNAWTLARRTASPNFLAQNVVFERTHLRNTEL